MKHITTQAFFAVLCAAALSGEEPAAGWKINNLTPQQFAADFQTPPPGYGDVAFYWWLGDPLTKERISWQLDQLAQMGRGMTGLQINYAHSHIGGHSYGLTYPSEPPLFSEEWWNLTNWFMQESKNRGIAISLSDYTLGIGQGWKWDEAVQKYPEIIGNVLHCKPVDASTPDDPNAVSNAVFNGKKYIITARQVNPSIDPMHPKSGAAVVEKFFQPFLDRNPNEGGKGLNFFFSDELNFQVGGNLWNVYFADEFKKRKGYDVRPELAALFADIGERTVKVRLDYYDVLVSLSEENYFKPVYDWHQKNGMTYGCDHGGRGTNVSEFGDYFRTQRWNQGPGSDQPGLSKSLIKPKVAASIAHLNERPRVWLEGFYGSGWGTSSEGITDATFANFLMGYNLLALHGLYYSTHGGWWEWAPPCNHWRQPYWKHFKTFMDAEQRLAYLTTQGVHVCDIAVWYPVAPKQAGIDAEQSKTLSFDAVNKLYRSGIDADFIDFQSIEKAEIKDGHLNVAGESYRVLVLPHPKAVRHKMLEKAVQFAEAGGIVVTLGALPEYSDRQGANDPEVKKLAEKLPVKYRYNNIDEALEPIRSAFTQDITDVKDKKETFFFVHRKAAEQDIYIFYQLPANAEFTVRTGTLSGGKAELWDVWTGKRELLQVVEQTENTTRLRLNNASADLPIIVFSPGKAEINADVNKLSAVKKVLPVEGLWESEILPTLDNSFGDYRIPAKKGEMIGPESRQFQYASTNINEDVQPGQWRQQTYSFGPKFRQLGPMPAGADVQQLEAELVKISDYPVNGIGGGYSVADKKYVWKDYDFSWRYGVEGDPGHQGYHGLKENMYDEFIRLGKYATSGHLQTVRQPEAAGTRYYLWTSVVPKTAGEGIILTGGMKPAAAWINGQAVSGNAKVALKAGANPILLRYDNAGTGYFVVVTQDSAFAEEAVDSSFSNTLQKDSAWIWRGKETAVPDSAFFRKTVDLTKEQLGKQAVIAMTADDNFKLFCNGKLVGGGKTWNQIQCFNVTGLLQEGKNVIAAEAVNGGGDCGLIGELRLQGADGQWAVLTATDAAWKCNDNVSGDWVQLDFDDSQWKAAAVIAPFGGSLWAVHPTMGPPVIKDFVWSGIQHETTGPLAMRWYDADKETLKPGVLPFDVFAGKRIIMHYRLQTAPGTKEIIVEGKRMSSAGLGTNGTGIIQVMMDGGEYGGSYFKEPVKFICGKGEIAAGDWSKNEGLRSYSGGIRYSKTLPFTSEDLGGSRKIVLDLGRVVASAEVKVNGQSAGVRVASPWTFDIKPLLKSGDNRIEVEVYNTVSNHYLTIPSRYVGRVESGLIGPVNIELR
ncbi:MAG: hypothetical protein LBT89_06855 [Planctomycetaceae bacterium]|jgi:hypothetical protein|nr:hypothetical protein [Planctomycetaceae bacterium]